MDKYVQLSSPRRAGNRQRGSTTSIPSQTHRPEADPPGIGMNEIISLLSPFLAQQTDHLLFTELHKVSQTLDLAHDIL